MKDISIVVPTIMKKGTNLLGCTIKTLDNIVNNTKGIENNEVILVDDGSDTDCIKIIEKRFNNAIKIIYNNKNLGFAKSVNVGITNSNLNNILLLNNDVIIKEQGWLIDLSNGMDFFNADIVSPKQSFLDERYNYIDDKNKNIVNEKCFSYPVGWCVLIKRSVFEKVGLFPENFGKGFWEDTAWFFNVKNNYPEIKYQIIENIYRVSIDHMEHQTFRSLNIDINKQYLNNRNIFLEYIQNKNKLSFPKLQKKEG